MYHGSEDDVFNLIELVKSQTKATRRKRQAKETSPDGGLYNDEEVDELAVHKSTPRKASGQHPGTPKKRKSESKPLTPSHRKYVMLLIFVSPVLTLSPG